MIDSTVETFNTKLQKPKSSFFSTDLGHQTAQRIVQATDPLQAMQEINQNFPTVVSSLSRMKVKYTCKIRI